jgi:hypothetical protein
VWLAHSTHRGTVGAVCNRRCCSSPGLGGSPAPSGDTAAAAAPALGCCTASARFLALAAAAALLRPPSGVSGWSAPSCGSPANHRQPLWPSFSHSTPMDA